MSWASRQDYSTPHAFIAAVEARFGPLVCDLAASHANAKAPKFYDETIGSLEQPWADNDPTGNLWINPPFRKIDPWAAKCAEESSKRHGLILMLTPASIDTHWFARHVHRKAMVIGLSPRLVFDGEKHGYPKALMLSVFSRCSSGFDVWQWQ